MIYNVFGDVVLVMCYYNCVSGIGNVFVQLMVMVDLCDVMMSFVYDIVGLVMFVIDVNGMVEYFYYNVFGEKLQWNNKLGGVIGYIYNWIGQFYYEYQNKDVWCSDGSVQVSGNYNKFYYYDVCGNWILEVDVYSFEECCDIVYIYDCVNCLVFKQFLLLLVFNLVNEM